MVAAAQVDVVDEVVVDHLATILEGVDPMGDLVDLGPGAPGGSFLKNSYCLNV